MKWDDPDGPTWDSDEPQAVWDAPDHRGKSVKTNLQIDDVLGFGNLLRGAANEYKAKLIAAENSYDPTAAIASSGAAGTDLGQKKAAAKIAVDEGIRLNGVADDTKNAYYTSQSNWCDLMAATLGKETPEGKRILDIRASLHGRGPNNPPATPPTPPTPPPTP